MNEGADIVVVPEKDDDEWPSGGSGASDMTSKQTPHGSNTSSKLPAKKSKSEGGEEIFNFKCVVLEEKLKSFLALEQWFGLSRFVCRKIFSCSVVLHRNGLFIPTGLC